jgi:DNA repair protein SbcD/Mre11
MAKPLAAIITDVHLKHGNKDVVLDIFYQFIKLMKKLNLQVGFFAGDMFTERAAQNIERLIAIKDIIKMFKEAECKLYCIAGNHDLIDLTSSFSYLSVYEDEEKLDYFELFQQHDFFDLTDKIRISMIPYVLEGTDYMEQLKEAVKFIDNKKKNVLITHISVVGAKNNDGSLVTDETGIAVKYFNKFDKVIVGHYHESDFIKPNIYYIGSAYQSNFGERDDNKGFTVLYDDLSLKQFASSFKKYKKLKVAANDKKALAEILTELKKIDLEEYNVRLILTGSINEIESLDCSAFKELGVDIKFENNVETIVDFENIDEKDLVSFSDKEIMKNYILYSKEYEFTSEQRIEGLRYLKQL